MSAVQGFAYNDWIWRLCVTTVPPVPTPVPDWQLLDPAVQRDQIAAYDALRDRLGVAYSPQLHWSVFGHAEVLRTLQEHETFSNVVSTHMAVPNGMDPPEHTAYRAAIEPFFTQEAVDAFAPTCQQVLDDLLQAQQQAAAPVVDVMAAIALPFAVRVQCAFMGWPLALQAQLTQWIGQHHQASRTQDRAALATLGEQFNTLVAGLLQERIDQGDAASQDVTTRLLHTPVHGAPLSHAAIASIVRNWTVGEIGTIAASVGILAQYLAAHPDLQATLRTEPQRQAEAIEEILRLHGPLGANRRVATCPVTLSGRELPAGSRLTIHWPSANRDPRVFADADQFRWGRNPADNLLYGAGIHVCPGAPLARMELQLALRSLLAATTALAPAGAAVPAQHPAMGFSQLPLALTWAA